MERTPFEQHCDKLDETWDSLNDFEKDFFSLRAVQRLRLDYRKLAEDNIEGTKMKDRAAAYYYRDVEKVMENLEDDIIDRLF